MAVRDLVIGMLLGDEDGEGRDDLFHYVLDNTEVQLDMPIDETFKFSANLICMQRIDTREIFRGSRVYGVDSNSDSVYDYMTQNAVVWYPCIIAWENNVPLFMSGYTVTSGNYFFGDLGYYTWEDKRWYYQRNWYEYVPGSLRFENNEYEYIFNQNNVFEHRVRLPKVYFQTRNYSAYVRNTSGERPKVIGSLNPTTSDRSLTLGEYHYIRPGAANNGSYDVHSDLSFQEVVSKYREMTEALYQAKGINYRDCYVEPDEWE